MFVTPTIIADTETHRTCGTCMIPKTIDHFYKDGHNKDETTRYRRDCKECYRKVRLTERKAKRPAPPPKLKPTRRKKK